MTALRNVAASAAMAAGMALAGASAAHAHAVLIVRGGAPASIVETREAGVRVFRGTAPAPIIDVGEPAAVHEIEIVAGGSRVWLVDGTAGKLSVCRLVATTQVGGQRIDCHSARLPR